MNKKYVLSEHESREMLLWLAVCAAVEEADGRNANSRRLKKRIERHMSTLSERTREFIGRYGILRDICPQASENLHASASGVHQLEEWLSDHYLSAYQARREHNYTKSMRV